MKRALPILAAVLFAAAPGLAQEAQPAPEPAAQAASTISAEQAKALRDPITKAIGQKDAEALRAALEAIPKDVSIADVEDEGAGFASLGVMVNFPECFSILKEYGYDFNRLGADGMSVLHFVATNPAPSYDRVAMARALIQCGADPSLPGRDETRDQLLGAGHYTPTLCAETALRVARGRTPALLRGRDPDQDIAEAEALLRYLRAAAENYRPAPKGLAEALKVSVVDSRKVADEISVSLSLNSLYHAILSRSEMEVLFHLNALKSKRNLSEIVLGGTPSPRSACLPTSPRALNC